MPDTFTDAHRGEITSLATRYRIPAVCPFRFYAKLGCLLSYGNEPAVNFKRAAQYADRILRGAKPNDLPVQAPTEFVLTINLKTARALGLDVPVRLLRRADELIE
jgi:putative tryptophan/tyrosine transport system substrate-binding protein